LESAEKKKERKKEGPTYISLHHKESLACLANLHLDVHWLAIDSDVNLGVTKKEKKKEMKK